MVNSLLVYLKCLLEHIFLFQKKALIFSLTQEMLILKKQWNFLISVIDMLNHASLDFVNLPIFIFCRDPIIVTVIV